MALLPPGASRPQHPRPNGGSPFDAAVFAGGGCRCFWQSGFWAEAAPALGIVPDVVAAVSAGAALASAALLDVTDDVVADFKRRTAANRRNAYPRNALSREPVFPHEAIYGEALISSLRRTGIAPLRTGPELRVLVARPPPWAGDRSGFLLGGIAFALDRYELRVHARWGRRFGFVPEVVSARSCADEQALAHLILHSSCTPPLLPLYRRGERIVLDGGLIDNAPASWVGDARSTLVLLTRHFAPGALPQVPGRTYVCPSEPVPIVKWDYTSPELIQRTYDLGRRDGEAFAASFIAPVGAQAPMESTGARLAG